MILFNRFYRSFDFIQFAIYFLINRFYSIIFFVLFFFADSLRRAGDPARGPTGVGAAQRQQPAARRDGDAGEAQPRRGRSHRAQRALRPGADRRRHQQRPPCRSAPPAGQLPQQGPGWFVVVFVGFICKTKK